jgi:hypothetical protein
MLLDKGLAMLSEIRTGAKATARGVHIPHQGWTGNKTRNVDVTVQAIVRSAH